MLRKLNFILLVLIVCASTAIAQNSNFTEFNIEDGLIMSQIESITQDNKGNLWVGTIGGLSKYDGTSFVNYTQKEGLAEDWVTICHFNKTSNTLWLGHRGGGISYLKGDSSNFTDPMLEEFTRYGLVRDLLEIEGNLWIAVENVGLVQYNIEAKTAQLIQGIEAKHLSTLFLDQNKMLWVGTEDGTFIVNTTNSAVIVTPANTNLEGSPAEDIIGAMGNEVWIATMNGIQRHKLPSSEKDYATSLSEESNLQVLTTADGLTSNQVHTLFEDDQHYVWIGTQKNGVLQYVPNQFNNATAAFTKGALTIFSNKFEMRYYQANTFFQDRESNVWMGTEFGLLKYMGELFKIYDQHDNLINNLVWSILEDRKGNMWFGTSEGVSRFTFPSVKGKVQYHNPQSFNLTTADGLPENIVISIHQTSDNNIWMGTEHSGVFSIDESGNVQQKFTTNDGLADSKAYSITEDKEGNIWVGTNGGLSVIASDNSIKTYTKADGLGGDKVYKVFCDSKGRIWCGILGGDLTVYENGTFTTFGEKEGIPQKFITSIAEDNNQNLWLGAYSDGVIKYDGKTFKLYSYDAGLHSNSIHFVTCDNENNIWIGQNIGIEKFDAASEKFILYGRKQGFNGIETNENAVCKDASGNIWFGTIRGAIKFDPKQDAINPVEPLTHIEQLNIFMHDAPIEQNTTYDYDQNYLTFYTKGVCLTNPDEVHYKYRMVGFNDEWTEPTKTSQITYSNLGAGDYEFQVISNNNNGVWNTEPTTYTFSITPPFWETWWFYTVCGAVALGIIILVIQLRERQLKATQALLEDQVEKRTRELNEEKEVVVRQNKNITESINYAQRIQQAILPPQSEVDKLFNESFIYFKPKDIVSGDFYWINAKNGKSYVAAVDCTGHGVPGAFMSMIGYNILEKILGENAALSPADILTKLSDEITKALRQGSEGVTVKDGMDMSLITIDNHNMEMEFAGAYNPIYLVRNKALTEYKANKVAIGKGNNKPSGGFTNQKVVIEKGDIVYLFSDGFPDQKGGPKTKKFFYRPFRELLTENSTLPMDKQKNQLETTINAWRGDIEQFDDIMVLGIKV